MIYHYRTVKNDSAIEEVDPEIFASAALTEARTDMELTMERVLKAIRKLKQEYQDIVIMRFIEELSLKEIAAAIGKSEGAVKLIQHRALKELRTLLS